MVILWEVIGQQYKILLYKNFQYGIHASVSDDITIKNSKSTQNTQYGIRGYNVLTGLDIFDVNCSSNSAGGLYLYNVIEGRITDSFLMIILMRGFIQHIFCLILIYK